LILLLLLLKALILFEWNSVREVRMEHNHVTSGANGMPLLLQHLRMPVVGFRCERGADSCWPRLLFLLPVRGAGAP
jgi:hypothetical protein